MKHRSALGIVLALAVGAGLASMPALAQHGPHGGPHGPHLAFGAAVDVLHSLDLSEEQRNQIHTIVQRYRQDELADRMREVGEARRAHQLNIWDPKAREADLAATAETVAQRVREVDAVMHRMAAEVLSVLTEDQRVQFRTKLSEAPIEADGPPMGAHPRMPRQAGGAAPEH